MAHMGRAHEQAPFLEEGPRAKKKKKKKEDEKQKTKRRGPTSKQKKPWLGRDGGPPIKGEKKKKKSEREDLGRRCWEDGKVKRGRAVGRKLCPSPAHKREEGPRAARLA
jgi:hypothetical protein